MPRLIDLLTEGHTLYFPPMVEAMAVNADFAAVIERAIQAEAVAPPLLAACEGMLEQHDAAFAGREEIRERYYAQFPWRERAYSAARAAITRAKSAGIE